LNLPDLVIVALVEGVADILPIDPSAHALLISRLLGWRAGTIAVAIHLAEAMALLVYLWRETTLIGQGLWKLRKVRIEPGTRLLVKTLVASVPWIVLVSLLGSPPAAGLGEMLAVGVVTILCALAMWVIDRMCMTVKRIDHVGGATALAIGFVQLLAFFPGVGRVAVMLTCARLLGLERPAAYRFVLLVNVPVLLAAAGQDGVLASLRGVRPAAGDVLAFAITFILVLLAAAIGMAWIRRFGLVPFAAYRLLVGAALVVLALI
jgi:undecaprenyl-diphosphatase